jgi:hypothetical protein
VVNVQRYLIPAASGGRAHRPVARLLAAGTVVAGLGVLTACGAADAARAETVATANLATAKVASFTLHLSDPRGSLAAAARAAENPKAASSLAASTLTVTIDPAGDATLGQTLTPSATPSGKLDPATALKNSGAMDLVLTHAGTQVVDLRLIDGVVSFRANLDEMSNFSGTSLTEALTSAPPALAPVVNGLKAGKWLSLDLPALLASYPQLSSAISGAGTATSSPQALLQLRTKLLEAFRANSTSRTTTENGQTVVHVSVKAKSFLTAAMDALDGVVGLSGATPLSTEKAKVGSLSDGTVDLAVAINNDHYTRATMDLHSLALVSGDAAASKATEGVQAVVDINDHANGVSAPPASQTVSLNDLVKPLLSQLASAGVNPTDRLSGLDQPDS